MNELESLVALIASENSDAAKKLVDIIKANIDSLDSQVTKQESLKIEALKNAEKASNKYGELLLNLKIPEDDKVTESVGALLKKIKEGDSDSSMDLAVRDKEIETLKKEVAEAGALLNAAKESSKAELTSTVLERDIATILPKYNAKPAATSYITNKIKEMTSYEDGKLVFTNDDGTTLRIDAKDASLDAVVKNMYEEERESQQEMFFNTKPQPSGAGSSQAGAPIEGDFVP